MSGNGQFLWMLLHTVRIVWQINFQLFQKIVSYYRNEILIMFCIILTKITTSVFFPKIIFSSKFLFQYLDNSEEILIFFVKILISALGSALEFIYFKIKTRSIKIFGCTLINKNFGLIQSSRIKIITPIVTFCAIWRIFKN